jgi:hypothetical protein
MQCLCDVVVERESRAQQDHAQIGAGQTLDRLAGEPDDGHESPRCVLRAIQG